MAGWFGLCLSATATQKTPKREIEKAKREWQDLIDGGDLR